MSVFYGSKLRRTFYMHYRNSRKERKQKNMRKKMNSIDQLIRYSPTLSPFDFCRTWDLNWKKERDRNEEKKFRKKANEKKNERKKKEKNSNSTGACNKIIERTYRIRSLDDDKNDYSKLIVFLTSSFFFSFQFLYFPVKKQSLLFNKPAVAWTLEKSQKKTNSCRNFVIIWNNMIKNCRRTRRHLLALCKLT